MFIKKSSIVLLMLVFSVVYGSKKNAEINRKCTHENGVEGKCKPSKECETYKLACVGKTKDEQTKILLSWKCRTRRPMVCCPEFYEEPTRSVVGHRNLPLLRTVCEQPQTKLISRVKAFGGKQTGIQECPWMALIYSVKGDGQKDFYCGGSIINKRYILTAAHCITDIGNRIPSGVRVGEYDLSTETDCEGILKFRHCNPPIQDIAIEKILPHSEYVGSTKGGRVQLQHDIGLLRLAQDIELNRDNIMEICLPTTRELQRSNLLNHGVSVAGWGRTNVDYNGIIDRSVTGEKGHPSSKLLKIELNVITNFMCAHKKNSSIADGIGFRQMCAVGFLGMASCNGDSGGPLIVTTSENSETVKNVQFGIVSAGTKDCNQRNEPGIYTRVAHYMDWILDQLEP